MQSSTFLMKTNQQATQKNKKKKEEENLIESFETSHNFEIENAACALNKFIKVIN